MAQETMWTLIPRGYDKSGKAIFTIYVSPYLDPNAADPTKQALNTTHWLNWFDTVAQVIHDSQGSFLQIKAASGAVNTLRVTVQADYPKPAGTQDPDRQLQQNRRDLWHALTQIYPSHIDGAPLPTLTAKDAAGASTGNVWTSNIQTPNRVVDDPKLAALAWAVEVDRAGDPNFPNQNGSGSLGKRNNDPFGSTQALRQYQLSPSSGSLKTATTSAAADARFTVSDPHDPNEALRQPLLDAINAWTTSATLSAEGSRAVQAFQRDLARISYGPTKPLQVPVIAYIYNNRGTQSGDSFPLPSGIKDLIDRLGKKKKTIIDAVIFHRRLKTSARKAFEKKANQSAPQAPLTLDQFQRALAVLSHYPKLMYCLGLAFDVVGDAPSWDEDNTLTVQFLSGADIALGAEGNHPSIVVTKKMYPADKLAAGNLAVEGGFLTMTGYQAYTYDMDGLVLRRHLDAESPSQAPLGTATDGVLPLRSAGISVVHEDHANQLLNQIRTQLGMRGSPSSFNGLFAKDLIRGFSPEVQTDEGWISLTSRAETFTYQSIVGGGTLPKPLLPAPDVRMHTPITLEAAFSTDTPITGTDVNDPHIASAVFRWNGWSLVMPNPFGQANGDEQPIAPQSSNYPIGTDYSLPAGYKLPRLRFGKLYGIRVRALDLLGNPIETPSGVEPAASELTPKTFYPRHDPVPPPVFLVGEDFDPGGKNLGEQIDLMAVRDGDATINWRYLCPPAAHLLALIEQGALDSADSNDLLSPFEVGSFKDVRLIKGDFPVKQFTKETGDLLPIYQLPSDPPASGDYLPDTFAHYVNAQLIDTATNTMYGPIPRRSFYNPESPDDEGEDLARNWPDIHHMRVRLWPSIGGPHSYVSTDWDLAPLTSLPVPQLNVFLPPGWQMSLVLSCAPTDAQAATMATDSTGQLNTSGLSLIANGLSTSHTPTRSITLVHAVKKPLVESFPRHVIAVPAQDTSLVTFVGSINVGDGRTAGSFIVKFSWDDYVDDPSTSGPRIVHHEAALTQIPNLPIEALNPGKNIVASGAYLNQIFDLGPDGQNKIQQFLTYKFPNGNYRKLTMTVDTVTRFQSFFPTPAPSALQSNSSVNEEFVRTGKTSLDVPVLNTSSPRDVPLSHILPLLAVHPDLPNPKAEYLQYGGAFRIHLKRGWFSSGNGEMLGIVLVEEDRNTCKATDWEADPLLSTLFTRWGHDPVWNITDLPTTMSAGPTAANFIPPPGLQGFATPGVIDDCHLLELANVANPIKVRIIAYNPVFTAEDGWYCDVILNGLPSYNCFLRVALVRYQPNSMKFILGSNEFDRAVSKVLLAPHIQLLPDRGIRIVRGSVKHTYCLVIYGVKTGVSHNGEKQYAITIEMEHGGVWTKDSTATCDVTTDGSCGTIKSTFDGTAASPPLLQIFMLKIMDHKHHRRRVRVDEAEIRTGYTPGTMAETGPFPFWISIGRPIDLP